MQHIFGSDCFPANAGFGKGHVFGDIRIEVVANHQHVEMLVDSVDGIGQRRICGGGQNIRMRAGGDDIRRMAAARAFGVKGMNGAIANCRQRIFNETGLIERIAVQRDLDVHLVGHGQRAVDSGRRGAPVFMDFQANCARADLLAQGVWI